MRDPGSAGGVLGEIAGGAPLIGGGWACSPPRVGIGLVG